MAFALITKTSETDNYKIKSLDERNIATMFTSIYGSATANGSTYGFVIDCEGSDEKTLYIVKNNSASGIKTITFKAGNGLQGLNDMTIKVAGGAFAALTLDSLRFENVSHNEDLETLSGVKDVTGKIVVETESADIAIGVIQLV